MYPPYPLSPPLLPPFPPPLFFLLLLLTIIIMGWEKLFRGDGYAYMALKVVLVSWVYIRISKPIVELHPTKGVQLLCID